MSELVRIPFHGTEVLATDVDGRPHVVLRPAIEALGLDYPTQYAKLRDRSWATVGQRPMVAADGKLRDMVTVDVRTFLMLLATIDENRVSPQARPLLVAYQSEVADAIEAYWTRGVAVNPRVSVEEAAKVIAIFAQAKVGDAGFWDAKARQLAGRVLGETPDYDPATRPLTVAMYLAERGIRGKEAKSTGPTLGRWVKAAYTQRYGTPPPEIEDLVDRHLVRVAQYQEQHRDLFDRAWQQIQSRRAA